MSLGLVGRKCGMTRLFLESGVSMPVTVVHVFPNFVTQLKTVDKEGYSAVQVTMGQAKRSRVNKPELGHFAKAKIEPGLGLWEFRLSESAPHADLQVGSELSVSLFSSGDFVDVRAVTKGKGFAGVVKRHSFSMQDATHGNSLSHRVHGSTGQRQSPGRVFKNKRMAGHLGNVQRTAQNLEILKVDTDRGVLLVKGSIPGPIGNVLLVLPAVKKTKRAV